MDRHASLGNSIRKATWNAAVWGRALLQVAYVLAISGSVYGQNIISFNYATSSGGGVTPADPLGAAETAGAPGYNDDNWNNLRSDYSGTSGAIPSPLVYNDGTTVSGMTISYDAPNAWNNGIGTSTGDLKMMRNYLDSSGTDSPYLKLTSVPYRKFDVVVYADGDGDSNVIGPYVLRYGTGVNQNGQQTEAATNVTNLLRPVVWGKESGDFSGTYTSIPTTTSLSVAGAVAGNYMVFPGIKGNFTIDPTQTTSVSRAPLNGVQLVKWETTNTMTGAGAADKVALYSGNVTVSASQTVGSLATSVGTYGDLQIDSGVTLTLANGDLDVGDINHWIKGSGSITSSTNTLTVNRDISNGLNYAGGATDAAINGAKFADNGGNPLDVVKSGGGKLRVYNSQPYTGTTTVSQGALEIRNSQSLGNATSTVQINDATTSFFNTALYLLDGITLGRNISVNNQGSGTTTLGTLGNSGTQAFSGNITLNKSVTLSAPSGGTVNFLTGVISGVGGVVKADGGTVNLNSTNTYIGGTTVNGGVLNLAGGGGSAGTIRGTATVNAGATLRLSTGDATGYGGGASALTTINLVGGTMNVNTTSNQTLGGATINMTGASITGIAGSNLDFYQGSSTLNSLASATTSTISGVTLSPLRQGSTTFTVADGAAAVDLQINSVIQTSPSGDPLGAVLTKAGLGTMSLTAANTIARDFAVSAGTLLLNNTSGSATGTGNLSVAGGATLGGDGSTSGAVTMALLSILAPGNSPGSLGTGLLTLNDTTALNWELDAPNLGNTTTSDRVDVTGNLILDGILNVTALGSFGTPVAGDRWRLFNYTGSLTDNLVTLGTLPALTGGLSYVIDTSTAQQVDLMVVPEPSSLLLLLGGIASLFRFRRRRSR